MITTRGVSCSSRPHLEKFHFFSRKISSKMEKWYAEKGNFHQNLVKCCRGGHPDLPVQWRTKLQIQQCYIKAGVICCWARQSRKLITVYLHPVMHHLSHKQLSPWNVHAVLMSGCASRPPLLADAVRSGCTRPVYWLRPLCAAFWLVVPRLAKLSISKGCFTKTRMAEKRVSGVQ